MIFVPHARRHWRTFQCVGRKGNGCIMDKRMGRFIFSDRHPIHQYDRQTDRHMLAELASLILGQILLYYAN